MDSLCDIEKQEISIKALKFQQRNYLTQYNDECFEDSCDGYFDDPDYNGPIYDSHWASTEIRERVEYIYNKLLEQGHTKEELDNILRSCQADPSNYPE